MNPNIPPVQSYHEFMSRSNRSHQTECDSLKKSDTDVSSTTTNDSRDLITPRSSPFQDTRYGHSLPKPQPVFDEEFQAYNRNPFEKPYQRGTPWEYYNQQPDYPTNPSGDSQQFIPNVSAPLPPPPMMNTRYPGLPPNPQEQDSSRFGWFKRHNFAYFTIFITLVDISVFIYELAKAASYHNGNPFQTQPYFNPMLGPSSYVQISLGSRYLPCMTSVSGFTDNVNQLWPCPNSTTYETNVCSLEELCSFGGFKQVDSVTGEPLPDQWWRMITPMFLHAGFIHIIFNLLLQMTLAYNIERVLGPIRYGTIYLASGVAGFVLGSNFSPVGVSSTGASGALLGIMAVNILLLITTKSTAHFGGLKGKQVPVRNFKVILIVSIVELVIIFFLGLLPGLDNFAHIGGFAMGLLLGLVLIDDPYFVYDKGYYNKIYTAHTSQKEKLKNLGSHLKTSRHTTKFFIWLFVRVAAFVTAILYFYFLIHNFQEKGSESSDSCRWCKYINCLPVNGWCDYGSLQTQSSSSSGSDSNSGSSDDSSSGSSGSSGITIALVGLTQAFFSYYRDLVTA
ncbi:BA75_03571T0 [Komagataella pastoris]|uniref:Rhomboid-type serine protease n=1 Tax=Komagataella pastoris TaxID=4922 RepID=A0A1B2JFV0_PICPA|nr:BA75_03571T0 [Komagataella pastoris]